MEVLNKQSTKYKILYEKSQVYFANNVQPNVLRGLKKVSESDSLQSLFL
jgi:hypothetical protein